MQISVGLCDFSVAPCVRWVLPLLSALARGECSYWEEQLGVLVENMDSGLRSQLSHFQVM